MEFECWGCGQRVDHDVSKHHRPFHWHTRSIAGGAHLLCDGCGHPAHFRGGVSPYLRNLIKQRHGIEVDERGYVVP